jgi:hypothetical protein
MNAQQRLTGCAALLLVAGMLSGCILVRTTEHRISLKPDGGGEAVLRLIDIRSDETVDSLAEGDFRVMMSSFEDEAIQDFEETGRTVSSKRLFARDDTLYAEIAYTFESLNAVEGLHVTDDELYVVINDSRDIVRTNGKVESWQKGSQRIVWDLDAARLFFQIREKSLPPSTSLARFYRNFNND